MELDVLIKVFSGCVVSCVKVMSHYSISLLPGSLFSNPYIHIFLLSKTISYLKPYFVS